VFFRKDIYSKHDVQKFKAMVEDFERAGCIIFTLSCFISISDGSGKVIFTRKQRISSNSILPFGGSNW